jgi:hypothetical protein
MRPLEGIRVLEIGQYIAAPYCAMLLADQGAEAIKFERPSGGDPRRKYDPRSSEIRASARRLRSATTSSRRSSGSPCSGSEVLLTSAVGVLILSTMNNLFSSLSIATPTQLIIKGLVVVLAVAFEEFVRRVPS